MIFAAMVVQAKDAEVTPSDANTYNDTQFP
jgi:hypothetical protein